VTSAAYWLGWTWRGLAFLVGLYVVICAALYTASKMGWFR
jgi:hypothetical protein